MRPWIGFASLNASAIAILAVATLAFAAPHSLATRAPIRYPPEALSREAGLTAHLQPGVRAWIDSEAARVAHGQGNISADVARRFPRLAPGGQADALRFLVLMRATHDLDSLNEQSETQSLELQMTMDRRSKLIDTLSNVLKKISDTGESVVQNLK